MNRVQSLIITSHPGPSLAITALTTLLAAQAAPHGIGPALTAPALLAGQLSIGWSNDACDAARDAAAGRTDKPLARGDIGRARGLDRGRDLRGARTRAGAGHQPAHRGAVRPGGRARLGVQPRAQVDARVGGDVPARIRPAARLRGEHAARAPGAALAGNAGGRAARPRRALRERAARPGDRQEGRRGRPAAAGRRPLGARGRAGGRARPAARRLGAAARRRDKALGGHPRPWWPRCCSPWRRPAATGQVPFFAAIGIAAVDVVLFALGGEALSMMPRILAVRSAFPEQPAGPGGDHRARSPAAATWARPSGRSLERLHAVR